MTQFYAMCDQLQWGEDEEEDAEMELEIAVAKTFDIVYGTDVEELAAWQKLHRVVHDGAAPGELETCRNASNSLVLSLFFCPCAEVSFP